jgi:hypothetical protein
MKKGEKYWPKVCLTTFLSELYLSILKTLLRLYSKSIKSSFVARNTTSNSPLLGVTQS